MEIDSGKTVPAPAERLGRDVVGYQRDRLIEFPHLITVIQSLPYPSIIINWERQILLTNDPFRELVSAGSDEDLLGKRPGEILNCIYAENSTGGCGTTEMCEFCGALRSILGSQETGSSFQNEARMITKKDGIESHFDLLVTSSPLDTGDGDSFFLLTLVDTTSQKRRRMMEHVFFHDILNTAFGLMGTLDFIREADKPDQVTSLIENAQRISENLVEEITYQKNILAAESGDLKLNITEVGSFDLLNNVIISTLKNDASRGKEIRINGDSEDFPLVTDEKILRRVLVNMAVNALEASEKGGEVILNSSVSGDEAAFTVHNDGIMSREVQGQLWQRSFSTKGEDRGIGTYSMKMFAEQYLGGRVEFVSNEEEGTIFSVRLKM
ncbi:MAG: sensor histidine kinase [Thermoplasmatota archaeon]